MHASKTSVFAVVFAVLAPLAVARPAAAQREVHWQINPYGFPDNASVFIDVQEGTVFRRDLPATSFAMSMDEYAGDQGGWVTNQNQRIQGQAGGMVLILIDISRSYTGEFDRAKKMAKAIVDSMQVDKDQVAVATSPTSGGYEAARLTLSFTNNKAALAAAIDGIAPLPKGDETGARMCDSLNEGLKFFPDTVKDKYRAIVFISGGADKGEGKGDCVQSSYYAGKVPFYTIVFALDRKYDDPRNAHKIENGAYDLAKNTGGQSSFRRTDAEVTQFIGMFWNRVRSQYLLQVAFPCFTPAPQIEHTSVLKVEAKDADGIKFRATSAQAPAPVVSALYPQQASRTDIDDGKVDLTIDGSGFCGGQAGVKAFVNNASVQVKSANPFRVVASLNSLVDTGTVKIANRFGQTGESALKFEVVKPPKGAEASSALTALVIVLVGIVVIAVVAVALKSRKGKAPAKAQAASAPAPAPAAQPSAAQPAANAALASQKTMAIGAVPGAFVTRVDGSRVELAPGANLIGREPHCKIKLEVAGVSREHAKIEFDAQASQIWITDLGSTNGTHVGPKDGPPTGAVRIAARTAWTAADAVWIGGEKLLAAIEGASKEG
jgi:hypothetical protein